MKPISLPFLLLVSRIWSAEKEQTSQKEERELQKNLFCRLLHIYVYIYEDWPVPQSFSYERNGPITLWAAAKRVSLAFLNRGWREKECVCVRTHRGFLQRRRRKKSTAEERESEIGRQKKSSADKRADFQFQFLISHSVLPPSHRLAFARRPRSSSSSGVTLSRHARTDPK